MCGLLLRALLWLCRWLLAWWLLWLVLAEAAGPGLGLVVGVGGLGWVWGPAPARRAPRPPRSVAAFPWALAAGAVYGFRVLTVVRWCDRAPRLKPISTGGRGNRAYPLEVHSTIA